MRVLSILIVIALASAEVRAEPELYDYQVVKGDTCIGIAIRELGGREHYRAIHRHNRDLGPLPHVLEPGRVLKLPRLDRGPDAHLTDKRGLVMFRQPAAARWADADTGMGLFRRWRVNSRERATAELTFRDKSTIRLRENTVVIVYGPTRSRTRALRSHATLERGTLRARLGELDRKRPLVVDSPSSEATLSAGSALISVDDAGTSRVANHRGKAVRVRARERKHRKVVRVAVGMGSKVPRDLPPEDPRPLPPTPSWVSGARYFATAVAGVGTISGRWSPVTEARRYRVEIATDPIARIVVASVEVPASVTEYEVQNLPAGTYYASVASIDGDEFESIPSPREQITLSAIKIRGAYRSTAGGLSVVAGTTIELPDGVSCETSTASRSLTFQRPGVTSLTCSAGDASVSLPPIEVVALQARLARSVTLRRGLVAKLRIELSAGDLEPPEVAVTSDVGLVIANPRRSGRVIEVDVTPLAGAPALSALTIRSASGLDIPLARIDLEIEAPDVTPAVLEPRWVVGGFGGLVFLTSGFEIGGVSDESTHPGAIAGLRLAREVTPRWSVGASGLYSSLRSRESGGRNWLVSTEASAIFAPLRHGLFSPHLFAGLGLLISEGTLGHSVGGALHFGAGATVRVAQAVRLRLDVRNIIGPDRTEGLASGLDSRIGFDFEL